MVTRSCHPPDEKTASGKHVAHQADQHLAGGCRNERAKLSYLHPLPKGPTQPHRPGSKRFST